MRVLGEALFNTFSERMFRLQFADIGQNGAASPICDAKQRVHVGIRGQHFYDIQVARLHRVPEGSGIVDHKVRVSGVRLPKKLNVAQSNGLFSLLRIRPEVILRVQWPCDPWTWTWFPLVFTQRRLTDGVQEFITLTGRLALVRRG